ncbi:hypothetical protein [Pseudarthrobacter sp. 1C304]|uniref:hypothetical protein n=1 Tax=Pseudarthrobacter sp. 1C304 TaxID=3457438 RepID=UPI003FCF49C0
MDYELRIIAGCPNSAPALDLFRQALAAENAAGDVRVVQLDTEEQATALHFHGSPSFIADGLDLFPSPASPALTCRVYKSPAGLAGLPSLADLLTALRSRS